MGTPRAAKYVIGDLVHIDWIDSSSASRWTHTDVLTHHSLEPSYCQTVGWIVKAEETYLTLAASYGDRGTPSESICGVMSIPRVCIATVRILT